MVNVLKFQTNYSILFLPYFVLTHMFYKKIVRMLNSADPDQTAPSVLFVCVEVLRPSQPIGVMLSAVSLPNHTSTGQA